MIFIVTAIKDKVHPGEIIGNSLVFEEESFHASIAGNVWWKYPLVDKIAESRNAVFLYFKEDSGLCFAKEDFVVGDSVSFLHFIEMKTGKKVISVK